MSILRQSQPAFGTTNEGLPQDVINLLTPEERISGFPNPALAPYEFQLQRFQTMPGYGSLQRTMITRRLGGQALPYLTAEGIRDTWQNTQEPGETHRLLTPRFQELLYYPETRRKLIDGINESAKRDTERLLKQARKNGGVLECDVAIVGSGPHGAASAAYLRQRFPSLNILMIEQEANLGGLWGNNGPEASFRMNSRVRRPNNNLPNIPRTPGNINPLGRWATMELADTVTGNYAWDIENGYDAAINGHINVNAAMVGVNCNSVTNLDTGAELSLTSADGQEVILQAAVAIIGSGIEQTSTLNPTAEDIASGRYYDTRMLYRHFGNHAGSANHRPLAAFAGQTVLALGAGDSFLTGAEAFLGNLPAESYGPLGVGRDRVAEYVWVGAPGEFAAQIDLCLRSRYKDGIVQALPKGPNDRGATISPVPVRARGFEVTGRGVEVRLQDDRIIAGDVMVDNTSRPRGFYGPPIIDRRQSRNSPDAVFRVGPGAGSNLQLPPRTLEKIRELGIGANTVALWATMGITDQRAQQAGEVASDNVFLRNALRGGSRRGRRSGLLG